MDGGPGGVVMDSGVEVDVWRGMRVAASLRRRRVPTAGHGAESETAKHEATTSHRTQKSPRIGDRDRDRGPARLRLALLARVHNAATCGVWEPGQRRGGCRYSLSKF